MANDVGLEMCNMNQSMVVEDELGDGQQKDRNEPRSGNKNGKMFCVHFI